MKDHVEIGYLTNYDASRMNRDQVMDLEIWFKIHTNISNFEKASPKTIETLKIFYQFCDNCNILRVYMILGDAVSNLLTFVWILNHISRSITWSLFILKASYLVK